MACITSTSLTIPRSADCALSDAASAVLRPEVPLAAAETRTALYAVGYVTGKELMAPIACGRIITMAAELDQRLENFSCIRQIGQAAEGGEGCVVRPSGAALVLRCLDELVHAAPWQPQVLPHDLRATARVLAKRRELLAEHHAATLAPSDLLVCAAGEIFCLARDLMLRGAEPVFLRELPRRLALLMRIGEGLRSALDRVDEGRLFGGRLLAEELRAAARSLTQAESCRLLGAGQAFVLSVNSRIALYPPPQMLREAGELCAKLCDEAGRVVPETKSHDPVEPIPHF